MNKKLIYVPVKNELNHIYSPCTTALELCDTQSKQCKFFDNDDIMLLAHFEQTNL